MLTVWKKNKKTSAKFLEEISYSWGRLAAKWYYYGTFILTTAELLSLRRESCGDGKKARFHDNIMRTWL